MRGKLCERLLIDIALEFDHRFHGRPVFAPAPRVEFGLARSTQAHVAVAPHQSQQKPDLLLAAVIAAPLAAQPLIGHIVAQPFTRTPEDTDVLALQTDLLLQLSIHCRFWALSRLDAALRKLPRMLFDPLAPKNLVFPVT